MKKRRAAGPFGGIPVTSSMCAGKRKYRTQGDALDAAMLAGVERERSAYLCPLCNAWHLTTRARSR